jgi:hypothetical protein
MRHRQAVLSSPVVAVAGLLAVGCGASHSAAPAARTTATTATTATTHLADAVAHPHIGFLSPRTGARVGATVRVSVHRSAPGRVRFILDGHGGRTTGATTLVYRHLAPGGHRVKAELLAPGSGRPAATAVVRFQVRRPPPPPLPAVTTATPSVTQTTPSVTPTTSTTPAAPAPPVQTRTTTPAPPPPPATTTAPAPATGIPQNGGGDDDSDNHGAPSDGDGDI